MEKQPFDNYNPNLFPRITKAVEWIKSVALAGSRTELCLSEHTREQSNQMTLDFEIGNGTPTE